MSEIAVWRDMEKWQKRLFCVAFIATAIVACATWSWAIFAKPAVQAQIDITVSPIVDAIEYGNSCFLATMTDEQRQQAEYIYTQSRKMRCLSK